jgi:hypothetical protein
MHAVSCRIPLLAGALILLVGCYSNNGGLIDLDAGFGGGSPRGPDGGLDGGSGGGAAGNGGAGGNDGAGGGAGSDGGGGGAGSGSGGGGGDPLTGTWHPAVVIDSHEGTGLNPRVSITTAGRAVAVWVQASLGEHKVWANRFAPIWGWEGDSLIGTTDGNVADPTDTSKPDVVVDTNGVATAAWGNYGDPVVRGLVSRRYVAPGMWQDRETIYDGASTAGDPRLALDATGRVTAVFATGTGAWANSFESPDGWGDAEIIDNETNAPIGVQVALDPGGDGWAAWTQAPTGIQYNIFGNTLRAGSWGDAGKVEQGTLGSSFEPQLAIDADGNVLFIWRKNSGLQSQVWSNRWDVSENELTDPDRLDSTGTAGAPAVASDPHGNGTAVWLQASVGGVPPLKIVARRYRPDSGWSTQEILADGDITLISGPRVAMDSEGNAVVAYTQQADTWARTYSAGAWQPAVRLSPDEGLAGARQPSVAMDPDGRAVVVWREGPDILASAFY